MEETSAVHKVDRLGLVLAAVGAAAAAFLPFIYVKANRIAAGKPMPIARLLDQPSVIALVVLLVVAGAAAILVQKAQIRLVIGSLCLVALMVAIGITASTFTPPNSTAARMSPGGAFWVLFAVVGLIISDALVKIRLAAWQRIAALLAYTVLLGGCLASGLLDDLSILKEFSIRGSQFWTEALAHLRLAFGSLAIAALIGLPLGILCFWLPKVRAVALQALSIIQTIPSLALFGLLMVPLGSLAAGFPLAAWLGIHGIGAAPALIALVLYALLPIVANTVVGLDGVDPAVRDAATGMGLTRRQILTDIELPLALPIILTGIRIVLVQTIGLVAVAALVGGGGFGVFIFQGLGQTAMDLVLLGAVPTVFFAFSSAVILDAVIDTIRGASA